MAKIQVFKHGTDTSLGKGDGSINKKDKTASITSWDRNNKAGLTVGTKYKLKSGGKFYSDAECSAVGLPAQFKDVE